MEEIRGFELIGGKVEEAGAMPRFLSLFHVGVVVKCLAREVEHSAGNYLLLDGKADVEVHGEGCPFFVAQLVFISSLVNLRWREELEEAVRLNLLGNLLVGTTGLSRLEL